MPKFMTAFGQPLRLIAGCLVTFIIFTAAAQAQEVRESVAREVWVDTSVTTEHVVTIEGEEVPYTAAAGTLPVWNEEGEPIASIFYVYYRRSGVENRAERPLVISFNGGPGSASVWMHLGYTSPRRVKITDEGFPVQPYGTTENHHSILDVADIVYVNPVNTGFSRIVGDSTDRDQFFGVNADIEYLADWIDTFVSHYGRWRSPKFLIGESYGTTRVSGLAGELQDAQWMHLNGVILVSPTGLGIERDGPVRKALYLPYYAATAWYHEALGPELQQQDLSEILPEVEQFTVQEYIPALVRGGALSKERRQEIAQRIARYAGLSVPEVLNHNLAVPNSFFWKALLRERGYTVGRLDSRYLGMDRKDAGTRPTYDPALAAWNHAFAPAINHYLREELNYETELQYWVFGPTSPWEREDNDAGEMLRQAMLENPFLHVMIQSGYYDGATNYFAAKYTMWQINSNGRLGDRLRFEAYRSGHMMYLRTEDLATATDDIRAFIRTSIPAAGEAAKY